MDDAKMQRLFGMLDEDGSEFVSRLAHANLLVPFYKILTDWVAWQAEGQCERRDSEDSLTRVFAAMQKMACDDEAGWVA